MKRDYITVAEYAAVRGISKQAVYKTMKTGLSGYVRVVSLDGKQQKVLDASVLSSEERERWENDVGKPQAVPDPVAAPAFDAAQRAFDLLEDQIKEKDKLIESLMAEIAEKDRHIQEQSVNLANLLKTSQELQRNNQILLGIASGEPQQPGSQGESLTVSDSVAGDFVAAEPVQAVPQTARRGFWRRFFGG